MRTVYLTAWAWTAPAARLAHTLMAICAKIRGRREARMQGGETARNMLLHS